MPACRRQCNMATRRRGKKNWRRPKPTPVARISYALLATVPLRRGRRAIRDAAARFAPRTRHAHATVTALVSRDGRSNRGLSIRDVMPCDV